MTSLDSSKNDLCGLNFPVPAALKHSVSGDWEPAEFANLSETQKQRLTQILDQYLVGLENGEPVDARSLATKHPDLATAIEAYLATLNDLYGFAAGMRGMNAIHAVSRNNESTNTKPKTFSSFDLGDFTILKEIGRGGMGIVYEAQQRSISRRVALKLLPMAATLSERQIARFKNESRAAGQLQHPNIVPIFSVGSDQGIHYYAMQLIDGNPIDNWIEKQRLIHTNPSTTWQTVVRWGVDISEALHCAHESGVVHRDIKPSNLMLDRSETIWVTDFGLAQCHSDLSLTRSGDLLGTVRYMSPEQASGQTHLIDHRTDIYSLAATLYEMLTLRHAVDGEETASMLRNIESDAPTPLRSLAPNCPRDLSVVIHKAMAKRKDDRYESAMQLADDLKAVLDGRPTLAKPPTVATLAGRWISRHRRLVATSTCLFALAVAWLTISSSIILWQNQQVITHSVDAERYFNQASETVDRLGSRVAQKLAAVPGAEDVRRSVLHETLQYYEQFVAQATGDPKLRHRLANTHNRIGSLVCETKSSNESIAHFERAAKLFQETITSSSIANGAYSDLRRQQALNWNDLGLALTNTGQLHRAADSFRSAIAAQIEICSLSTTDAQDEIHLALSRSNLGLVLQKQGNKELAKKLFTDARLRLLRTTAQNLTLSPENHELATRGLSAVLSNLSSLSIGTDPQRSIQLLRDSIELQLELAKQSPNRLRASAEIATLYNNLGSTHLERKQYEHASRAFANAVRLQRQLRAIAPRIIDYQRDLALSLNNLAMSRQRQSLHDQAVTLSTEAIALQTACLPADNSDPMGLSCLGAMHHNQAVSLGATNRLDEAKSAYQSAIDFQNSALAIDPQSNKARQYLLKHYAGLLRHEVRTKKWDRVVVVSRSYREAATGSEQLVQVASDLTEIAKLTPVGSHRRRANSEAATAFASARQTMDSTSSIEKGEQL